MNTITCLTQPILILLKSRLASQLDIFKKTESRSSSLTASCLPEIEFNLDNRTYQLLQWSNHYNNLWLELVRLWCDFPAGNEERQKRVSALG
jgi:hypothetical protein